MVPLSFLKILRDQLRGGLKYNLKSPLVHPANGFTWTRKQFYRPTRSFNIRPNTTFYLSHLFKAVRDFGSFDQKCLHTSVDSYKCPRL
jgi:hypothetical protein